MSAVTVSDLAAILTGLVESGAGECEVFLAKDEEGNSFKRADSFSPALLDGTEVLVLWPGGWSEDLEFDDEEGL